MSTLWSIRLKVESVHYNYKRCEEDTKRWIYESETAICSAKNELRETKEHFFGALRIKNYTDEDLLPTASIKDITKTAQAVLYTSIAELEANPGLYRAKGKFCRKFAFCTKKSGLKDIVHKHLIDTTSAQALIEVARSEVDELCQKLYVKQDVMTTQVVEHQSIIAGRGTEYRRKKKKYLIEWIKCKQKMQRIAITRWLRHMMTKDVSSEPHSTLESEICNTVKETECSRAIH